MKLPDPNSAAKPKFPLAQARAVAEALVAYLCPFCRRIQIAGSIRREKPLVGDVEILYIPYIETGVAPDDLFGEKEIPINLADKVLDALIGTPGSGVRGTAGSERRPHLRKRPNKNGAFTWGQWNKLAIHEASGIPVDFFATREENWFNYLVCRTGSMESNIRIATAAQKIGWKWMPTSFGFCEVREDPGPCAVRKMNSEEEVFNFVNLPYLPPKQRV